MSAYLIQAAVLSDRAILTNIEVITYVDEATLQVVVLQLLWGVVTVLTRGGAVNNKITDGSGLINIPGSMSVRSLSSVATWSPPIERGNVS